MAVLDLLRTPLTLIATHGHAVFVASLGVFLAFTIYNLYLHPLAKVPGPFWAKLNRVWIAKQSYGGQYHRTLIALHKRHGPLVRIAPNEVSVADPTAIKTIYGAGTKFNKSDWYSVWQGHRVFDLFGERNEKIHGQQRRLVSRPYAMESLKDLEPYVDNTVQVFLDAMSQRHGQVIDLGKWVQLFAFGKIHSLLTDNKRKS